MTSKIVGSYVWIYVKKWMKLCRYNWEQKNGQIPKGFIIHHINGDKLDDRIENLQCMSKGEHIKHHNTHRTAETIKKISESRLGVKMSEETKKKLSEAAKNQKRFPFSEETKKKLSEKAKNRKPISEETRQKMQKSHEGKKLSEETKRKVGEKGKNRFFSEDSRKKMSEARKRYLNKKREEANDN